MSDTAATTATGTRDDGRPRPRLTIADVSKSFPGVRALDHVSFDVLPGEVHGLVGENGAGKSTLMAIASGSLRPDTGRVVINGTELLGGGPERAREAELAIVHQTPALMPDLTVAENLFLGVSAGVRPAGSQINAWARERLAQWDPDIAIEPNARVASLVPEERFIVEISIALAQRPTVLVLDEPTEHLSTEDVQLLFRRIRALQADGCAIVYISHRIHEVQEVADRITVLRDGRVTGTHAANALDEAQIVNLIVGRSLDSTFPDKGDAVGDAPVVVALEHLEGAGFQDISFAVRHGEIVGLAGIEGNGQRELLRALAGLHPHRGAIEVAGSTVDTRTSPAARRAGFSYIPADRPREGILRGLSVKLNLTMRSLRSVSLGGLLRGRREDARAGEDVDSFRIKTPSIDTPIDWLSGGNQQKVVIASVLASRPRVLLADEPSQGVDVGARLEIYQLLRSAAANGTAVIVVSSNAVELAGLSDRVLIFSRGSIVAEHAGDEVTERNITGSILTATSGRIRPRRASRLVSGLAGPATPIVSLAIAIIGLGAWTTAVNPFYLSAFSIGSMLFLAATLALAAFGQQVVMAAGGFDLSIGPLMGSIVVIESFFLIDGASGLDHAVGWILLLVVPLVVGTINWVLVEYVRVQPMIATLATFTALQGLSLTLRPVPGGIISSGVTGAIGFRLGPIPVAFIVVVALAIVLEVMLVRSRRGMALRGLGSNLDAARISGISPRRTTFLAYLAASVFAGLAAIPLMAQVGSGDPSSGTNYTLLTVAAVVIGGASILGGRGSFIGALLGALLIVQINTVTTFLRLDQAWSAYLLGAIMVVAVAVYSKSRELEVPR